MKMKNLKMKQIGTIIISGLVFMSCSSGIQGEKAKTEDAAEVKTMGLADAGFSIDEANSIVEWKGTKPSGEHIGSLKIKEGNILVKDNAIVGGKFSMDMTSIVNDDLTDAEWNGKLVDHLKSPDFFNTTEFPEAIFEISEVKTYDGSSLEGTDLPTHWISGNLTIKGISKNITFPAVVSMDNKRFSATTPQFNIDRTEWNIQYQSRKFFDNLKDKFIYDEIGLRISITGELEG
jgi:polyisoprenoid-binding protein YceI